MMSTSRKRIGASIFLITAGSCIFALGLNGILIPKKFLSGGVAGLSMFVHYLVPTVNVGAAYFVFNIPLFILGWKSVSPRFIYLSLYGMTVFSLAAWLIKPHPFPVEDPILAAILAGIICGTAMGIIFRSLGSAGGIDIIAVFMYKRYGLRMGSTSFFFNAIVLSAGVLVFDLDPILYSLIYMYASSAITDRILTGFNQRKLVLVISDEAKAITDSILNRLDRGVTLLRARGGYTGRRKMVVLSIIRMIEIERLKDLILGVDPSAFVVVLDTMEVLGKRHGERKVY